MLESLVLAPKLERIALALESIAKVESERWAYEQSLIPPPRPTIRRFEMGVATVADFDNAREAERESLRGGGFGPMPPSESDEVS